MDRKEPSDPVLCPERAFREGPAVAYLAVIPATKPQVALGDIAYRPARKEEAAPVWVPVGRSEKKENPNAETLIPAPAPAVEYDRV